MLYTFTYNKNSHRLYSFIVNYLMYRRKCIVFEGTNKKFRILCCYRSTVYYRLVVVNALVILDCVHKCLRLYTGNFYYSRIRKITEYEQNMINYVFE